MLWKQDAALPNHDAALTQVLSWLGEQGWLRETRAVGHRVVHGGLKYRSPQRVDAVLLENLQALVPLAPEHLPQAIQAINKITKVLPEVPQIACFDTSFHSTLPPQARTLPLPRELSAQGVVRFGFHGLSYEYLVEQLRGRS